MEEPDIADRDSFSTSNQNQLLNSRESRKQQNSTGPNAYTMEERAHSSTKIASDKEEDTVSTAGERVSFAKSPGSEQKASENIYSQELRPSPSTSADAPSENSPGGASKWIRDKPASNYESTQEQSRKQPKKIGRYILEKNAMKSFEDLPKVDELVQEYLLFRGFTQSFHTFTAECSTDNLLGLNVPRIVDQLFSYIDNYDMPGLLSLWNFLDARFFHHLESRYRKVVLDFDVALKRYYIIHSIQSGRPNEAVKFFEQYGESLSGNMKKKVPRKGKKKQEIRSKPPTEVEANNFQILVELMTQ